jgi:hypothetical protein
VPHQRYGASFATPLVAEKHECCLGLAHEAVFAAPASIFTAIERAAPSVAPLQSFDQLTPVGIRDGPHRPRGPPLFA